MSKLWLAITKLIEDKAKDMSEEDLRGNLFAFGDMRQSIYDDIRNFNRPDFSPFKKGNLNFTCMINVKHVLKINSFPALMQEVQYIRERLNDDK